MLRRGVGTYKKKRTPSGVLARRTPLSTKSASLTWQIICPLRHLRIRANLSFFSPKTNRPHQLAAADPQYRRDTPHEVFAILPRQIPLRVFKSSRTFYNYRHIVLLSTTCEETYHRRPRRKATWLGKNLQESPETLPIWASKKSSGRRLTRCAATWTRPSTSMSCWG